MRFFSELNFYGVVFHRDGRAVFEEIPVDGLNIASLESGEFARERSIEVVGQQRKREVEIHLDDDG